MTASDLIMHEVFNYKRNNLKRPKRIHVHPNMYMLLKNEHEYLLGVPVSDKSPEFTPEFMGLRIIRSTDLGETEIVIS